jgi:cobalt-zinc-cadmium efflux system membrane fusion protein
VQVGRVLGVVLVIVVAGGSAVWLANATGTARNQASSGEKTGEKKDTDSPTRIRRADSNPNEITVPPEVQNALGLKTAPATLPTRKRTLPAFQGTLNFDSTTLARVQTMFSGTIVELGTIPETLPSAIPNSPAVTAPRALRVGDKVTQGDTLAVVWSKDLGEKKSEYVGALVQLKTDVETLRRLETLFNENGTAERSVREAERTVKADRIAVERAEATLKSWRIAPEDIVALQTEAEQVSKVDAKRTDPAKWARAEIKAPLSGVILERNVGVVGQVVDPSMDLYRIGNLSSLAVWVHLFEEDLPLVQSLPLPVPWVVTLPSRPGVSFPGKMEMVAASIDPSQHTALVTGTVENKNRELRAGMTVTVTVELSVPTGELEIPAEAVLDDGRESAVFVRPNLNASTFVRRTVSVVRRSRDIVSIVADPNGVKPGDHVVTAGSLLLDDAVNDLPQTKR